MDTKILIAEDHPMMRDSIERICKSIKCTDFEEVDSCDEVLDALQKGDYSHLILDLVLADGDILDRLSFICHTYRQLRIVIYSSLPSAFYRPFMWEEYGIVYLSKVDPAKDTMALIKQFLQNEPIRPKTSKDNVFERLSPGEIRACHFLMSGISMKEIAREMKVADSTVRVLKLRILDKVGVRTIDELKRRAERSF